MSSQTKKSFHSLIQQLGAVRNSTFIFLMCLLTQTAAFSFATPKSVFEKDISTKQDRDQIQKIINRSVQVGSRQPDAAIKLLQSGLKLARQVNYKYGEANLLSSFANINERYRNVNMAVKYQKEVLAIYGVLHDTPKATATELALGRLYGKLHLLDKSTMYLKKVLLDYKKQNNVKGEVAALIALGNIHALNKKYRESLVFDQMADSLLEGQPLDTTRLALIEHIAQVEQNLGHNQQAMDYYELGINKSNTSKFATWHVAFLRKAGELWDEIGNHANAVIKHQQSLQKARQFNMPEAEVRSQMSLALSLRGSSVSNSIAHMKNALSLAQSIGNSKLSAEIFKSLSNLYQQQEDFVQALNALRQHQRLIDSLQTLEVGHRLAILEGSFELAENKIHIQNLELNAQKKTERHKMEVLVMLSLVLLLGFFVFYYLKTKTFNRKLEQANVTKDKLFSIIGHDLRGPIGGMIQMLDLLDLDHKADAQQMVVLMKSQGSNALSILQALLSWGETQLKGVHVQETVFQPQQLIQRNLDLLEKQIEDKHLHVSSDVPEHVSLLGDANHFDFIIRNLLSNAIKFSFPKGSIEIRSSVIKGNRLQFSVQDHGKGVTPEQLLQFQKANMDVSYGTTGEKGTGLGLLLSKEFARANADSLTLQSTVGGGASFFFSFKLQK